jgi:kynurenine formamidase
MARIARFALGIALVVQAMSAVAEAPEHRNWGRWGDDDQRGAANYITPERVVASAQLIQRGKVFALGIGIDGKGPIHPTRTPPTLTTSVSGADYAVGAIGADFKFADDYLFMPLQGATQWDGLSHAWYGDTLYNGVPESAVASAGAGGATRLGIENVKDSMVGRGVLVDILRYKGGSLPRGYAITRDDIEKALLKQGSEVRPGDIVLFHTGYLAGYYELNDPVKQLQYLLGAAPGLGPTIVPWLYESQVAGAAADNVAFEAITSDSAETPTDAGLHGAMLKDMGVYIGEIWWLNDLAADCAEDGRYEFFLAAQPLNIPGGVGSPLNPIAIK